MRIGEIVGAVEFFGIEDCEIGGTACGDVALTGQPESVGGRPVTCRTALSMEAPSSNRSFRKRGKEPKARGWLRPIE